mmetsp:Transcript_38355/g.63720  ORF Transcript_38355/g.63720 Transcript_38355/m.63720 type:complete len:270 (+) Transcript_38355:980-1789(+)
MRDQARSLRKRDGVSAWRNEHKDQENWTTPLSASFIKHACCTQASSVSASSSSIWYTPATNCAVTPPGLVTMSASSAASSVFPCSPLRRVTSSNFSRSSCRALSSAAFALASRASAAALSAASRRVARRCLVSSSFCSVTPAFSRSSPNVGSVFRSSSRSTSASASSHCLRASCTLHLRQIALAFCGSKVIAASRSGTARRQNSRLISACPRLLCSTERTSITSCTSSSCMGRPSDWAIASRPRCHAASASLYRFPLKAALPSAFCSST